MENAQAHISRAKPTLDAREGVAWGVLRLLFSLFFGNPVAKLLAELESLFEAWRNGTLPPIPAPRLRDTRPARIAGPTPQVRQRRHCVRRAPVARIAKHAARPPRKSAWQASTPEIPRESVVSALFFVKNRNFDARKRTPISLRKQNEKSLFASFSSEKEGLPYFLKARSRSA